MRGQVLLADSPEVDVDELLQGHRQSARAQATCLGGDLFDQFLADEGNCSLHHTFYLSSSLSLALGRVVPSPTLEIQEYSVGLLQVFDHRRQKTRGLATS